MGIGLDSGKGMYRCIRVGIGKGLGTDTGICGSRCR